MIFDDTAGERRYREVNNYHNLRWAAQSQAQAVQLLRESRNAQLAVNLALERSLDQEAVLMAAVRKDLVVGLGDIADGVWTLREAIDKGLSKLALSGVSAFQCRNPANVAPSMSSFGNE